MADRETRLEWPACLRDAPVPATVSQPAAKTLRDSAFQTAERDLAGQRQLCAAVQEDLGRRQLGRYNVRHAEGELGGVPVHAFYPSGSVSSNDAPVLLNLHGGGFTKDAGSFTENVPLAALVGTKVVAVRYRLAPEFPFPAAVDDAETVYRELLKSTPADRICLYGTSSGATLCAQLLVRLRRAGSPLPAALGFFSSTADLSRPGDTEHFFRPERDIARGADLFASYVGDADPVSPEVSPIFGDLSGFPPTLCIAATRDFALSQTALFHRSLLAAGVHAELVVFEAMLHAHWIYLDIPESTEAFQHMANFFQRSLRESGNRTTLVT
jgi:epsilon-lactone hydrolase